MTHPFTPCWPGTRQIRQNAWGRWEGWEHGRRVRVFADTLRFSAARLAGLWQRREKYQIKEGA